MERVINPSASSTMKLDLPYLYCQRDRYGKPRYYFRYHGTKQRIKEEPGTQAFYSVYNQLLAGIGSPPRSVRQLKYSGQPGALKWLCELYFASGEFKALAPRTQYVRRMLLEGICLSEWRSTGKLVGSMPFAQMEPEHVRELKDRKADFPEAANGLIKALRQLFAWGKTAGHMKSNPALEVAYVRRRTSGHHAWTIAEVRQFEERWPLGTKEYLAMAILLFTGCRRQDAPLMGKGMEHKGELSFRAQKTGQEIVVPIRPELRAAIDACPSGHMTFLVTEFGKPFTSAGFGNWFGDRCRKAGVPGRAHGLRKAGATILADNGASAHELMAIYGWSDLKEAELYTRKANRARLARSGMKKMRL